MKFPMLILGLIFVLSCEIKTPRIFTEKINNKENKSISFDENLNKKDTIKIGLFYELSGTGESTGIDGIRGAETAIEEFNTKYSIMGKKIEAVYFDNMSKESGALLACENILKSKVVAIIGPSWSGMALACAPKLQKKGIPMIATLATNPKITKIGNKIFRICFTDEVQGKIMAQFALKHLKARKALLVVDVSAPYSTLLSEYFHKTFQKGGGHVEKIEFTRKSNFQNVVDLIKKSNADVIYLPSYHKDSGPIIKMSRLAGVKGIFLGGDGWGRGHELFLSGGKFVLGSYSTAHWHPSIVDEKSLDFILRFARKFKKKPYHASALSYDATTLLLDVIKKINSTNGKKISKALTQANFVGVTGKIHFNVDGDPIKPGVIQKIIPFGAEYVAQVSAE